MLEHLLQEPVGIFLIAISVILLAPMLSRLVRLPGIVGLILGGVIVGPYGLGILEREGAIELLATIGLVYLMFSAGAEIDLSQFGKVRNRSLFFGILTFTIPQLVGTVLGLLCELELISSVLLGSIFASHTLISFPIITRLGIAGNEAVAVTVGATIITDIGALLMLAGISGISTGEVTLLYFVQIIVLLIIYTMIILWALPRLGRFFFTYFNTSAIEFQFVLVVIFVAAFIAEIIGMEAIVGAFLAGLAINSTVPRRSETMGRVLFIGESLFIPIFLISIGLLINPTVFFTDSRTIIMSALLVTTILITKYAASRITGWWFGYTSDEVQVMWGLSMAQAAATLAAALIGLELNLLDEAVFNGVIAMILVTCIMSPILIERYGPCLTVGQSLSEAQETINTPSPVLFDRVLVPIANPNTGAYLIEVARLLADVHQGKLMPLHISRLIDGHVEEQAPEHPLLELTEGNDADGSIQLIRRIDTSIANGILSVAIERSASSIVMGWSGDTSFHTTIFGTTLDEVIWNATIPVLVLRLTAAINTKKRVYLIILAHSLNHIAIKDVMAIATITAQAINAPLKIYIASNYMDDVLSLRQQHNTTLPIEELDTHTLRDLSEQVGSQDLIIVTTYGSERRFQSSLGQTTEDFAARTSASLLVIRFPIKQTVP